jgi:hypothetical protein
LRHFKIPFGTQRSIFQPLIAAPTITPAIKKSKGEMQTIDKESRPTNDATTRLILFLQQMNG